MSVLGLLAVAVLLAACDAPPPPAPDLAPISNVQSPVPGTKKSVSSKRKKRARPPLPPWGIMDLIEYKRCTVGRTGTIDLKGAIVEHARLSIEQLDRPPLAKKVPGEGRHSKDKAVPLAALFPEGARVRLSTCQGESTLIEPGEDWWLVKSRREFVKGIRLDTRAEILRDLTLAELVLDEAVQ